MTIWNATQHPATPEQTAAGVRDLDDFVSACIRHALTFETLPDRATIEDRAAQVAGSVRGTASYGDAVMIGGAPWLMHALEDAVRAVGLVPLYAFSTRDSVETRLADGSVRKVQVFRHAGFVPA
jgi:hypothetical protein